MRNQCTPIGVSQSATLRSLFGYITLSIRRRILTSQLRSLVQTADDCVRVGMTHGDPALQALYEQGQSLCREYALRNEVGDDTLFFTLPSLTRLRDLASAPDGTSFSKLVGMALIGLAAAIGLGLTSGIVVATFHLIAGGK